MEGRLRHAGAIEAAGDVDGIAAAAGGDDDLLDARGGDLEIRRRRRDVAVGAALDVDAEPGAAVQGDGVDVVGFGSIGATDIQRVGAGAAIDGVAAVADRVIDAVVVVAGANGVVALAAADGV